MQFYLSMYLSKAKKKNVFLSQKHWLCFTAKFWDSTVVKSMIFGMQKDWVSIAASYLMWELDNLLNLSDS